MNAKLETPKGRWPLLIWLLLTPLVLVSNGRAQSLSEDLAQLLEQEKPAICPNQTYALCAGASCFIYNKVAYCTCDVLHGNSISQPLSYDNKNKNVCDVNGAGPGNGYMVSTFSLRPSLIAPTGNQALYTCPRTSSVSYAKCDGGICFTSTTGSIFPGSSTPVSSTQIVCSCPIEHANPLAGIQFIGPYPCQKSFFDICRSTTTSNDNGGTVYSAGPISSEAINNYLLTGTFPQINTCDQ